MTFIFSYVVCMNPTYMFISTYVCIVWIEVIFLWFSFEILILTLPVRFGFPFNEKFSPHFNVAVERLSLSCVRVGLGCVALAGIIGREIIIYHLRNTNSFDSDAACGLWLALLVSSGNYKAHRLIISCRMMKTFMNSKYIIN